MNQILKKTIWLVRVALTNETNTYARYQIASIKLIKALGGGWSQDNLIKCSDCLS